MLLTSLCGDLCYRLCLLPEVVVILPTFVLGIYIYHLQSLSACLFLVNVDLLDAYLFNVCLWIAYFLNVYLFNVDLFSAFLFMLIS